MVTGNADREGISPEINLIGGGRWSRDTSRQQQARREVERASRASPPGILDRIELDTTMVR